MIKGKARKVSLGVRMGPTSLCGSLARFEDGLRNAVTPRSWEQPSTHSQPEHRDLGLRTFESRILPTSLMSKKQLQPLMPSNKEPRGCNQMRVGSERPTERQTLELHNGAIAGGRPVTPSRCGNQLQQRLGAGRLRRGPVRSRGRNFVGVETVMHKAVTVRVHYRNPATSETATHSTTASQHCLTFSLLLRAHIAMSLCLLWLELMDTSLRLFSSLRMLHIP